MGEASKRLEMLHDSKMSIDSGLGCEDTLCDRCQQSTDKGGLDGTDSDMDNTSLPFKYDTLRTFDEEEALEDAPLAVLVTTYLAYFVLISIGHVRDFFGKLFRSDDYAHLKHQNVRSTPQPAI